MKGRMLLRFACAAMDAEAIVAALRAITDVPIHVRDEIVRGIDYADAGTSEQVTGSLRRSAVELIVDYEEVHRFTDAAGSARRRLPIRWIIMPVIAQGRIA